MDGIRAHRQRTGKSQRCDYRSSALRRAPAHRRRLLLLRPISGASRTDSASTRCLSAVAADLSRFRGGAKSPLHSAAGRAIVVYLAFSGSHRKKRRGFLLHILTSAFRALWILFVVLVQCEDYFEGLVAVEANIIINGH